METEFVASCLFGLEKLVSDDIEYLGYKKTSSMDGRVTFTGDISAIARCNINFRYSERVFIKLGEFEAPTFDALYEGVKKLEWSRYIGVLDAFPVKGHAVRSKLFSVPDCQKIVKKAVVDALAVKYGQTHFDETGIKYQIEFFIFNDKATLMIDTSGVALHKRGYRLQSNAAPLRETLAAAMVNISRPRDGVIIVDPMCGSGTIPIEAALLTTNTAPGINRGFAAEDFSFLPHSAWIQAREEAKSKVVARESGIFGSDIDQGAVAVARANARRAGVYDKIMFSKGDVRAFDSPLPGVRGTIVTNPPYGERIGDKDEVDRLYAQMGAAFSKNVPAWQLYILNSNTDFSAKFGRRPDKVRTLYNGMLKCGLYQFFRNNIK